MPFGLHVLPDFLLEAREQQEPLQSGAEADQSVSTERNFSLLVFRKLDSIQRHFHLCNRLLATWAKNCIHLISAKISVGLRENSRIQRPDRLLRRVERARDVKTSSGHDKKIAPPAKPAKSKQMEYLKREKPCDPRVDMKRFRLLRMTADTWKQVYVVRNS